MTLRGSDRAASFSEGAAAYAETMAPSLRPVAAEVVRRAALQPGERVLDLGTGTGTAAAMAADEGRSVVGVDAAPGMLEIARREVPGVELVQADFVHLPMDGATFDVVLAVHALLFADDRVAALREWLRVARPGGRLSLSVPGPGTVVPNVLFGPVYDRYGIAWDDGYPTEDEIAGWAREAGWQEVKTDADPTVAIVLADADAFRTWLGIGARGRATGGWSARRLERFHAELMEVARDEGGSGFRLPFGALYLTARGAA